MHFNVFNCLLFILLKKPIHIQSLWFAIVKKFLEFKIQKEEKKISFKYEIEKDLNSILDKINKEGFDSLTKDEEARLYKNSKSLSYGKKKD